MSVTTARPVVERIAHALFERLQLLSAGYSSLFKASEVIRPKRQGGFTPKNNQIVMTQGDPIRVPELDRPGNPPAICFDQSFNVRCHIMPSEKDPTPVEEYINTMAAEVVRVVGDAGSRWFTFGELAMNATWGSQENIDSDGSFDGINLPLVVTYRVSEVDPYVARC